MNKTKVVIRTALAYLPILPIFTVFVFLGCFLGEAQWVYGVILMVLAIPLAIFGAKCKALYILAILMNSAGTGIIASYYFTYYSLVPQFGQIILPLALALVYSFALAAVIGLRAASSELVFVIAGILDISILIAIVVGWCIRGGVFFPLTFFLFILVGVGTILFGIEVSSEEDEILRDAAFASFGVLVTVGILVAVLVGGDGCDCDAGCCDCVDCGSHSGKRKKK